MVEERKPRKCGNSGRGEGNDWTVDENGGWDWRDFISIIFSSKPPPMHFFCLPCSATTFSVFTLLPHFYLFYLFIAIFTATTFPFFPSSTTTTTTFQLFHDITLWHHIDNTKMLRKNFKLKKSVGRSHHPCNLTLLYSLSFVQIKTELYRAKI